MNRIYHTWDKWECYPAGFYENRPKADIEPDQCEEIYATMLRNLPEFEAALQRVLSEWPMSCEHYLSNESMNRIAWLGQASLCIAKGIPSCFRGGFNRLTEEEQYSANMMAKKYLNVWFESHGEGQRMFSDMVSKTAADLY